MFAVLIPVGPSADDEWRVQQLVMELAQHEDPRDVRLLLVDDALRPRRFAVGWPDVHIVRTPLWRKRPPDSLSAHVAGTLTGMRSAGDVEFLVKLDTDAAIIGPFADRLREAFKDQCLGVVGSYDKTADGGVRDWSRWRGPIARASWPFTLARSSDGWELWRHPRSNRAVIRQVRAAAWAAAPPGAHCLGGAYAVSRGFLDQALLDWTPWVRTKLGEDVVVGLLCLHAGLRLKSLTASGEPFGLSWRGLPASPAELRARGYAIVHSVKSPELAAELALRQMLQSPAPDA